MSQKEKGGQCFSNGLLMIVGASTCEMGVACGYVGINYVTHERIEMVHVN